MTDVPDPFADPSRFPDWILPDGLSQRYLNDQTVVRIALEIDRELRPDLLMVFLPGIDRVSHRLWHGVEPRSAYKIEWPLTDAHLAAMGWAIDRYYEYTDRLIGLLAEGFGPDDLILVVSDHGFEAGNNLMVLTGVHDTARALHGVFFARGRDIRAPDRQQVVSVNDVAPTVLAWLGLPVGADMDGRVAPFFFGPQPGMIATHDTAPIEYITDGPSGAEGEILEQLRALGYFEAGSGTSPNGETPSP